MDNKSEPKKVLVRFPEKVHSDGVELADEIGMSFNSLVCLSLKLFNEADINDISKVVLKTGS